MLACCSMFHSLKFDTEKNDPMPEVEGVSVGVLLHAYSLQFNMLRDHIPKSVLFEILTSPQGLRTCALFYAPLPLILYKNMTKFRK